MYKLSPKAANIRAENEGEEADFNSFMSDELRATSNKLQVTSYE